MPRAVLIFVLLCVAAVSACRRSGALSPAEQMAHQKLTNRDITFFYENSALLLGRESRPVALPENDSAAVAAVVREWLKGPRTPSLARSLPPDTILRGAYLLPEGNAIVDLGGPTLVSGWQTGSNEELLGRVLDRPDAGYKLLRGEAGSSARKRPGC